MLETKQFTENLRINIAASTAHEANRVLCRSMGDYSQKNWREAPQWQKASCINGVRNVMKNPNITAEQSHINWMKEKGADGWKYGEKKNVKDKTHPCMVPFSELPKEQKIKDEMFIAIVKSILNA
jgi:hypothetical protein